MIMDEKQLVKQILAGDKKAIEKFCTKYQKPLLAFVGKRVKNKRDAQDVVQETLISGLNSLPNFNFKSFLFSWLCSIAKHEIADFYRKRKLKTILFSKMPFLQNWADDALGPQGKYLKEELKEEISFVLESLTEGYSKILRLKYIEGMTMKAIAKKLSITVKAVESRLYRARKKFRASWQKNH
jgi:RNA polymerase sigma factor (sigma-70 family)